MRGCAWGCGGMLACGTLLLILGLALLSRVPKTYPGVAEPIAPPTENQNRHMGLDGFDSPYLGHTGSWDGKGGGMFGRPKTADLDIEESMGLRWTFMAVYWRAMEPNGPVNLEQGVPQEWRELDDFVTAAQTRGLNILMQAPVVGGNAGGPPEWAGRREPGKSAPANMEAAANFAVRLARRYSPGGTLAKERAWGNQYGVRAWELDNEPESYRTHWKRQAADYAEFVTKAAAAIKSVDPNALIAVPAVAGGPGAIPWLETALDGPRLEGSPAFKTQGKPFSIGSVADVVSFHCYEGLETAFSADDRTIEKDFSEIRSVFEAWEHKATGFHYARKQDYWHTEGNFDFLGMLSAQRRAAWRFQFMTRGFAAGIRKLAVMDASVPEQKAVRAYVQALPNPFPMLPATKEVSTLKGQVAAFRHPDGPEPLAGQVWVLWAMAGSGDAIVELPAIRNAVTQIGVDGASQVLTANANRVRVVLRGDKKMAPGVLVVDRPEGPK
jgi:hypothetical protein